MITPDFKSYFDKNTWAVDAVAYPVDADPLPFLVVFTENGAPITVGDVTVLTSEPVALCETSIVSSLTQNTNVKINTVDYYIRENMAIGDGFSNLQLSRDPI